MSKWSLSFATVIPVIRHGLGRHVGVGQKSIAQHPGCLVDRDHSSDIMRLDRVVARRGD
jgi:hypothetical protein